MSWTSEEHELGEWIAMALDLVPPCSCGHKYTFNDVVTYDHEGGQRVAGISRRQYLGFRCPKNETVWSFNNIFTARDQADDSTPAELM